MNSNWLNPVFVMIGLFSINTMLFAAEQTPQSVHNPFTRPQYLGAAVSNRSAQRADGNAVLDLRATMSAGTQSLVNVAGEFYGLGDEIDGYRLLSVGDGKAVFLKNGRKVTMTVLDETEVD